MAVALVVLGLLVGLGLAIWVVPWYFKTWYFKTWFNNS
jgi:hypothetical protein